MKKITEMTEQEIRNLTEADIELMIKYAKAEAGIKLVGKPAEPKFHKLPQPSLVVFSSDLLGSSLCFTNINELQAVLDLISKSTSKCAIDYDWNAGSDGNSYAYYVTKSNFDSNMGVSSKKVYNAIIRESLKDQISENRVMKANYDKLLKEYNASINESKEIESEIRNIYSEVIDKFQKLKSMCLRMKHDYMPLSDNNETIAMNFLVKAYALTHEEITYINEHYSEY